MVIVVAVDRLLKNGTPSNFLDLFLSGYSFDLYTRTVTSRILYALDLRKYLHRVNAP